MGDSTETAIKTQSHTEHTNGHKGAQTQTSSTTILKRYKNVFAHSHQPKQQLLLNPTNFDGISKEITVTNCTKAASYLKFSSLDFDTSKVVSIPKPVELWQKVMVRFEKAVEMGLEYIGSLPGIAAIAPDDRGRLFSRSFLPMAVLQQLITPPTQTNKGVVSSSQIALLDDRNVFSMTPATRELFLSYFPVYQVLFKEMANIRQKIGNWKPSFADFAFLEALLIFNTGTPNLENTAIVDRLRRQLLKTTFAYLQSTCSTTQEATSAMDRLMKIYTLLKRLPGVHDTVIGQMALEHPDIVGQSVVFTEVYQEDIDSIIN